MLLLIKKLPALHVSPEAYLTSSIVLETACTLCLPKVNENKLWFAPIYVGYGLSFYLFPKALEKFQLNVAYAIWSSFGIIITYLADVALKKDVITLKKILGVLAIINGICFIK